MMMRHASVVLALILFGSSSSFAAEICGNGIDDDGNGLTDEGCYPTLTSGVCESPLSCDDTGDVSWATGSLHYTLPPDVTTNVPYGPGIGFRRIYTSMYAPGTGPASVNTTPLGPGWQHNYLTWIMPVVPGVRNYATWHRVDGRDVLFTKTSTVGSYDYYTPQAGDHVLSFRVLTGISPTYFVQLLTGETLKYNSYGQLVEIWDTLSTPNVVTITWDSTTNGSVSSVTDASGNHRLSFSYSSGHLITTQLQHHSAGVWSTDHTTSYSYNYSVSQDATSGWYVPANATEWANLLEGTGIPVPTNAWGCQDLFAISVTPIVGTLSLAYNFVSGGDGGGFVSGWSRHALTMTDGTTSHWQGSSGCNPATTACSMFALVAVTSNGVLNSQRDVMGLGDSNGSIAETKVVAGVHGSTRFEPQGYWNGSVALTTTIDANVHPWILSTDPVAGTSNLYEEGATATPTWTTGTSANGNVTLGSLRLTSQTTSYLYAAQWTGFAFTASQAANLTNRIEHGPTSLLASVTIGGQLAQQYTYGAAGNLLTSINDATSQLVSFSYSSTTPGRVNQVSTSKGTLGYEFGSSRTGCSAGGQTLLYFNQANATSCATDTDCGSGYMCGGQTGPGATGSCFKAARCLTVANVSGESVVTNVGPVGPGGGGCSGACAETMAHIWSSVSGWVSQVGLEDSMFGTTSYALCTTNTGGCTMSLPYQIGYGDNDFDPTNGGYNRTVWIYYDSTYPGRIIEVRRPSDISTVGTPCSYASTSNCDRTIYAYGSDNQLQAVEHDGYTLDNTGAVASKTVITLYWRDSLGRITDQKVIGGLSPYAWSHFDYFASTDPYPNLLKDEVDYPDLLHSLTTNYVVYDPNTWLPSTIRAPDGTLKCQSYNSSYGYLASSRIPMAGQTDCTTTNGADLTTSLVRDTWIRVIKHGGLERVIGATRQLTRPDGSCVITTVDSKHRPYQVLRRDDCNSSSSGDYEQYQYTPDSQVSEIDTYDSSGTVKKKQIYNYFAGRQLQQIVNPANTSTYESFSYDAAGRLGEVDGEANLTKSVLVYSGVPGRDNRVTGIQSYKDLSTYDEWDFLYSWMGDQTQVTDGDSKITGTIHDDFGNIVKVTSPDLAGPTLGLYDVTNNLTTAIEDLGGGASQLTHYYTYDFLHRPLVTDDPGSCVTSGTAHAEIQRAYDALPSGVTCPMTGGCNHLQGRLAYVENILMCSSTYNSTDGSLDQFTFYSYDPAGRVVEEYIKDDSGRVADQVYTYTKNGVLASITTPSGASVSWTYGSTGNNSDTDLVTAVSRGATAVVDTVSWFPFGPLQSYNQKNTLSSTAVQTTISRDLAYRVTDVKQNAGATTLFDTALSIDAHGRVTSRAYTGAATGALSSYFLYDEQNRVTCETSDFKSTCPSSGTDIKNAHSLSPPFTNAGDWKRVLRPVAGSGGGLINDINTSGTTYGTSHRITDINQSDGTTVLGDTAFAYDARGSRSSDDNTSTLAHDDRTYTYDGRRNLSNVRGQYYTGSAWHYYDVASAFDAFNRRVFKSFYDETSLKTSTWFFYYDPTTRLTEVVYTPDVSTSATYSVFQLVWLGDRIVAYWQTDYPSATTSKRYVGTDETNRPVDMWNWPASGDTTRVWALNPDAWGNDHVVSGSGIFQPMLFAGQYQDVETAAYENDGVTLHRPGLALNGVRTYDPFAGTYLQVDPLLDQTRSTYGYAATNPIGNTDPSGLMLSQMDGGSACEDACAAYGNDEIFHCVTDCETIVDMGLGAPGDYLNADPFGDFGSSSVWKFGNQPCFDVTCESSSDTPTGPSYWYGGPDGVDLGPEPFGTTITDLGVVACTTLDVLGVATGGATFGLGVLCSADFGAGVLINAVTKPGEEDTSSGGPTLRNCFTAGGQTICN
jgi:RHS repeat-associated protein